MTSYEDVNAKCPFFRAKDGQKIRCEGFVPGTSVATGFGDSEVMGAYWRQLCCDDWERCWISACLAIKYADEK